MHWPWISREAYVDLRNERDRLLTLVETLTRTHVAIERRAAGLPEREPQPVDRIVLTPAIRNAAAKWGSSEGAQLREAERMLRAQKSEFEVLQMLDAGGEDG